MKHLKNFDTVNEEYESQEIDNKVYAQSWEPTKSEVGDFDVKWIDKEGNEITATFEDSGNLVKNDDGIAHSPFHLVQGTSSDGKEYMATVIYEETETPRDYVVIGVIIEEI